MTDKVLGLIAERRLILRGMYARLSAALLAIFVAALVGGALVPAFAAADGDPASDVLLAQNVFYPYSPPVSASLQRALEGVTAAAQRAGFPIKVALIAGPVDLGVVSDLFGKPQRYAGFLDQEISYNVKTPVLVVMAAGLGGAGLGNGAAAALAGLARPPGAQSDDLARSAIQALPKLAAAAGHPIKGGAGSSTWSGGGTSGSTGALVFLIPLAVLVAAALVVTARARRRDRSG